MELKQFNKELSKLVQTGESLQNTIHGLAVYALQCLNVGKTAGEDSPIQRLWNEVNKLKGINRQSFMHWIQEYGMCKFHKAEDGNFHIKYSDRTKADQNFDPAGAVLMAEGTPFWEFAKEPKPNTKPYDVLEAMRNILAQAKSAATGGANGDKPKRKVEHSEMLDVINFVLASPDSTRQKLGLTTPSEDKVIVPLDQLTPDDEANAEIAAERNPVKLAA